MTRAALERRLRPFLDNGLLAEVPSRWQIRRAELEMAPYVVSRDATDDAGYRGALLGHPIVRQPLIASRVGLDHFAVGTGLGVAFESQCDHLHLTFHRGFPVFDLQILQTHPRGLERLEARTRELIAGRTRRARRTARLARLILGDPPAYHARFLGPRGWISRAAAFDYPDPAAVGSSFPPEFFSLTGLLTYALTLPTSRPGPREAWRHLGRRFREGGKLGWLRPAVSSAG